MGDATNPVPDGPIEIEGQLTTASNATFLGRIGGTRVVYKPTAGEKPLWDFPDHTLAQREVASYLVSEALGWDIVPQTWLSDGPFGPGMVQRWCDTEPGHDAVDPVDPVDPVDIVGIAELPARLTAGWLRVLDAVDELDRPVSLIHEDSTALRRMAVFDIIVNNADRKGGHVLPMASGHRHGVDHGLTFHTDDRLRTVLWGWVGEPLQDAELTAVSELQHALSPGAELYRQLSGLLSDTEVSMCARRCEDLVKTAHFPVPHGMMPAVPWPVF